MGATNFYGYMYKGRNTRDWNQRRKGLNAMYIGYRSFSLRFWSYYVPIGLQFNCIYTFAFALVYLNLACLILHL